MPEKNLATQLAELNICEITPCEVLRGNEMQTPLSLTSAQKSQVAEFVSHLPELTSSSVLANAYTVKFPEGISGKLMEYKTGGKGTPIIGENGIVGHASLHELSFGALAMGAFSVMAIASGQYYLKQINDEFKLLNKKVDNILEFLYGDKKAELMSEICFVQYACKNFNSIMEHTEQRISTITSLQSAQKTAMQDIEFYLGDLSKKADTKIKKYTEFESLMNDAFKIKDSLDMSMQLYAMTCIMEVHYSQNYDDSYISNLKENIVYYINKCDKKILSDFSKLSANDNLKEHKKLSNINKDNKPNIESKIHEIIDSLNTGDKSTLNIKVNSALDSLNKSCTFCIDKNGQVYKVS